MKEMDNSKKLTPREIAQTCMPYKGCVQDTICASIEQYAAQELTEKEALLKEVIDKGNELYNALMSIHLQFGDESHAFKMSNELYNWCDFIHSNNMQTNLDGKDGL